MDANGSERRKWVEERKMKIEVKEKNGKNMHDIANRQSQR